jgi:hypothetical protein
VQETVTESCLVETARQFSMLETVFVWTPLIISRFVDNKWSEADWGIDGPGVAVSKRKLYPAFNQAYTCTFCALLKEWKAQTLVCT